MLLLSPEAEEAFSKPCLFLLSDVHDRYYFAAEDEVKKEFWVTMLVQTIRDLNTAKVGLDQMGKRVVGKQADR